MAGRGGWVSAAGGARAETKTAGARGFSRRTGELTLLEVMNIYECSLHFRSKERESSANTLRVLNALTERVPSLVRKTLRQLNENAPNDFQDDCHQRLYGGISSGAVHREQRYSTTLQHMCRLLRSVELRSNSVSDDNPVGVGLSEVMIDMRCKRRMENRGSAISIVMIFDMPLRLGMVKDHSLINSTVEERACLRGHTPAIGKVSKRYDHFANAEAIRAKLDRGDNERRNFENLKMSLMELTAAALERQSWTHET
jgi:hypothetical protein